MTPRKPIAAEERGLVLSVLAVPEDMTTRLAYTDWLDEHDDPRGPWLRSLCKGRDDERLRARIDPDWAALLDGRDHFTVLLTAEIADHLRQSIPSGRPLQQLQSWATVQSDFRLAGIKPGDHLYPIQLIDGRIHVLTRMRVAALRDRTEPFTADEFLPQSIRNLPQLVQTQDLQIVTAADGGLLRSDCVVPRSIVERLRFVSRRGERGLSSLKNGLLGNVTTIHGVFKLAPASARDFGLLVFAPELLGEPSPPLRKTKT